MNDDIGRPGTLPRLTKPARSQRKGHPVLGAIFGIVLVVPFLALIAIATIWLCAWLVVHFPA